MSFVGISGPFLDNFCPQDSWGIAIWTCVLIRHPLLAAGNYFHLPLTAAVLPTMTEKGCCLLNREITDHQPYRYFSSMPDRDHVNMKPALPHQHPFDHALNEGCKRYV